MSKWNNHGLYASLASAIGILIRIKYPNYLGDWTDFSTVILAGLVAAGIISNPSMGKGFIDKKIDK